MDEKLKKVIKLQKQIADYELETPDNFGLLTPQELASIYNGAGPDWMPEEGRKILTVTLRLFEAAFLIHDVEFQFSDGTLKSFTAANKRMWRNIKRIIFSVYKWYSPTDWDNITYWLAKGFTAYRACARFGWSAWKD